MVKEISIEEKSEFIAKYGYDYGMVASYVLNMGLDSITAGIEYLFNKVAKELNAQIA